MNNGDYLIEAVYKNGSDFRVDGFIGGYYYYFTFYLQYSFNRDNVNYTKPMVKIYKTDERVSDYTEDSESDDGDNYDGYYFYGDMNRWSLLLNAGKNVSITKLTDEELTDDEKRSVFGTDPNKWPKYYTKPELKKTWMFKKVTSEMVNKGYNDKALPSGVTTDWYYLDFKKISDQGVHTGVLCGQFKITKGDHGDENWGISNGENSSSYYKKNVKTNTSTAIQKGSGLQNIVLDNNYVENAIIYFNPNTNRIYIEGDGKDLYVYYAVIGAEAPQNGNGLKWLMSDLSQVNYFVNTIGFNGKKTTEYRKVRTVNGQKVYDEINSEDIPEMLKTGGNNGGAFTWETPSSSVFYRNTEFQPQNVIRRRIPSGATHRYPIQINVELTDETGEKFQKRVMCDDIWFIRNTSSVNVHFRYDTKDATESLDWVCYNVFTEGFDPSSGAVTSHNYLFGDNVAISAEQPSITSGQWGAMKLEEVNDPESEHNGELWWHSPVALPNDFTNGAWAMFGDSRGGIYPAERVSAEPSALADMVIAGEDVWFTAATFENPAILYSHLNGTFNLAESGSNTVQINAEMFEPASVKDGSFALVSDMSQVKYRFEVYRNGRLVACNNKEGKMITGTDVNNYSNDFTTLPYFDWYIDGDDKTESGWTQKCMNFDNITTGKPTSKDGYYFIIVKCNYNGTIYTAQDTYAIYNTAK